MEQTNRLRRTALIYTASAFALTLIAILLRALSLSSYDASIGYFPSDALLPKISSIFSVAAIVLFAVVSLLKFRRQETAYQKKTPALAVRISAGLCAIFSLLLGIRDLREGSTILCLLCLGTCLYFLLVLSAKTTPALSLAFGFCAILRLLGELAISYRNFLVPMNSPEKLWLHFACVAGMLFLVSEIRALVTKPYAGIWFFSAATATLVLGTTSVALIASNLGNLFYEAPTDGALRFAVLLLTLAIYTGVRLVTVALCPCPEETEEAEETEEEIEAPEEPEPTEESNEESNEAEQQ